MILLSKIDSLINQEASVKSRPWHFIALLYTAQQHNPFKPEFTIVIFIHYIFIHYKLRIAVAILNL